MKLFSAKVNLIKSLFEVDSDHKWWIDLKELVSSGKNDKVLGVLKSSKIAKINDRKGNSVLHYASKADNQFVANHLISIGCDINHKNHAGVPPIAIAVASNSVKVATLLLKKGAICQNSNFMLEFGLLHIAIISRSYKVAKVLIKAGIDVNAPDEDGFTPLQLAIMYSNFGRSHRNCEFIKLLINAGAEVNVKTHNMIPLHEVCSQGNVGLVKLLLKAGADVNMLDENKYTPLYWALTSRCTEAVKLLIEAGVNINSVDCCGNTCLHYTAGILNPELTKILLENGAEIDIANEESFSPLLYALFQYLEDNIFDMLPDVDYDDYIMEHYPKDKLNDQVKVIKLLIKHGADINFWIVNNFSLPVYPPIYESLYCAHSQVIELLLSYNPIFDYDLGNPLIMNLPNRPKSLHHLMKYTALCIAQGEKNNKLLNFDEKLLSTELQQNYAQYKDELEKMKGTYVKDTWISYFSLLVEDEIRSFTCNEEVVKVFESKNLSQIFPLYWDMLTKRFLKAKKRQKLIESAMETLSKISGYDVYSYNLIFIKIVSYLDKKDLQNLTKI